MSFASKIIDRVRGLVASFDPSGNFTVNLKTSKCLNLGAVKIYVYTTAITTTVTDVEPGSAAGDIAYTSNATGRDKTFYSNGTKWVAKT